MTELVRVVVDLAMQKSGSIVHECALDEPLQLGQRVRCVDLYVPGLEEIAEVVTKHDDGFYELEFVDD